VCCKESSLGETLTEMDMDTATAVSEDVLQSVSLVESGQQESKLIDSPAGTSLSLLLKESCLIQLYFNTSLFVF